MPSASRAGPSPTIATVTSALAAESAAEAIVVAEQLVPAAPFSLGVSQPEAKVTSPVESSLMPSRTVLIVEGFPL